MAKSTSTVSSVVSPLTVDQVLMVAIECGLKVEIQKSFVKLTSEAGTRKAIYIGKAKRSMTRLDISGFEPVVHPAIAPLTAEEAKSLKLGAVRGQILPKTLAESVDVAMGIMSVFQQLAAEGEGFKAGKKVVEEETVSPEEEVAAA